GSNRRVFFQYEPWFNAGIPEMGRSGQENAYIPLQFLQGETFAFLWVFFPAAIRLRVKIGFMPLARGQHETAVDDSTPGRERSLLSAGRLYAFVQGQHASGILAAIAQDGVTPGRVGWRGRRGFLLCREDGGLILRRLMYRG